MDCLFNSCDTYYKRPFGALPAGQTVHMALTIPENLGYVDPHFVLQKDGPGDEPVYYRMQFDGQTPGLNHFSDVKVEDVGLYFYYFDLYTDFRRIFRGKMGQGVLSWQDGDRWQLTVYDPDFETPDCVKGGVFYQIFPDRFCEAVENKHMPGRQARRALLAAQRDRRPPEPRLLRRGPEGHPEQAALPAPSGGHLSLSEPHL